jgi:hypothetical protein
MGTGSPWSTKQKMGRSPKCILHRTIRDLSHDRGGLDYQGNHRTMGVFTRYLAGTQRSLPRCRWTRITCKTLRWSQWSRCSFILAGQISSSSYIQHSPLQKISRGYSEDIRRIQTILAALRWRSPYWISPKVPYRPYSPHLPTAVEGHSHIYPTTLST